ncbi:hypothetical protein RFI_28822 [Reticulomyxa filosa]|uniref:Uncharacterized protein n=1 Tax=Reticulomyxa filosa TaxID=46433 RepID=X6M3L8_RETFI|nr:hypothetical protein RFI_28822 [Reticulomyxa filosa]|eukprot:ETO08568.1 hypothetical protein RFI_28822 [Reticulomyxa filosa]
MLKPSFALPTKKQQMTRKARPKEVTQIECDITKATVEGTICNMEFKVEPEKKVKKKVRLCTLPLRLSIFEVKLALELKIAQLWYPMQQLDQLQKWQQLKITEIQQQPMKAQVHEHAQEIDADVIEPPSKKRKVYVELVNASEIQTEKEIEPVKISNNSIRFTPTVDHFKPDLQLQVRGNGKIELMDFDFKGRAQK